MEKLVDRFSKNADEEVRVSLDKYKGHQLLSLRVWTENKGGEMVPTRKGLTIKVELFPEFKQAVEKLEAAIIEAGLLDPEDL